MSDKKFKRLDDTLDSVLGVPEGPSPWEPMVPAKGDEVCLVCAACFECDVDPEHVCFDPLVSAPNEEGAVLIEVAVADLPTWYQRRCRWLASQLVAVADRADLYGQLADMLLASEASEKLDSDPTAYSSWSNIKGEA